MKEGEIIRRKSGRIMSKMEIEGREEDVLIELIKETSGNWGNIQDQTRSALLSFSVDAKTSINKYIHMISLLFIPLFFSFLSYTVYFFLSSYFFAFPSSPRMPTASRLFAIAK